MRVISNSMLSRIAFENWQEDPESEIFIDRDARRFSFVLDYLRDGNVVLPVTESKKGVMVEMKYFGIDVDEGKVTETRIKGLHGLYQELGKEKIDLEKSNKRNVESQNVLDLIHFCVEKFVYSNKPNYGAHNKKNNFEYKASNVIQAE